MKNNFNELEQWYVISVLNTKEDAIYDELVKKISSYKMDKFVKDIKLIKEKIVERESIRHEDLPKKLVNTKTTKWEITPNGNYYRVTSKEVNKYPGYIFIKMIITDETWYNIRNTPGVTGFIGSSGKGTKPHPIQDFEISSILDGKAIVNENPDEKTHISASKKEIVIEREKFVANFDIDDSVEVVGGPFVGQVAKVIEINLDKGVAKVEIDFLGRATPTEVEFYNIKKVK